MVAKKDGGRLRREGPTGADRQHSLLVFLVGGD